MNWFFNVVFLGTTCRAVLVEKVISSKSLFLPKLKVIEAVFKRSFQNVSHTESLESGKTRSAISKRMEMPQDDLSYLQHGYHPGDEEVWKLYRVWKAMNNVARHLPQIVFSQKESRTKIVIRELCERNAREHIGIDFEEIQCDPEQEYRSFNGTCNNIINTRWGSAAQPFERFVPADYGDDKDCIDINTSCEYWAGIGECEKNPNYMLWGCPRACGVCDDSGLRRSANDLELPNPRVISRALSASTAREQPEVSLMLMQWGQFLDHDITRTPELELEEAVNGSKASMCCSEGKLSNSESLWDDCVPIDVTGDDYYQMDGRECIRFVRSMPTTTGCDVTTREQINSITAFVDGSMVYGENADIADSLRTKSQGLLNTTTHENGQPLPPRGTNQTESDVLKCPQAESMDSCFLAGDVRIDEIPGLTALHTTFIRLHNIIAIDLVQVNPLWADDDERIYQETRRIVIALIQQTTYRDWLPHVVGPTLMEEFHLDTATQGYKDTYNASVNPSIRNVFATVAFRFGHSLIADMIKAAIPDNDTPVPGHFFDPTVIKSSATSPSSLLKGLTRCPSQPIDPIVERTFTDSLYTTPTDRADDGNLYGLDLVSLNIQRGRDHGIPSYREWRRFCNLEDIKDFEWLKKVMPSDIVHTFKQTYQDIDDIDLFPAGLAENAIADGILAPTFSCILARQFAQIKHGDRYWHEREDQPKPFAPEQLDSIRSQSLSSILCRVSEHTTFDFQPDPFLVEDQYQNAVRSCSSYNFINLQPWKEHEKVPCSSLGGKNVGGQCLIIYEESMSWTQAVQSCQANGQRLAVLQNPVAFNTYLQTNYAGGRFWLGASDIKDEGTWTWNSGQSLDGFPWPPSEPNDWSVGEDCLSWGHANNYNDASCTDAYRYVCEPVSECPTTTVDSSGTQYELTKIGNQCFYVGKVHEYHTDINRATASSLCRTLAPGRNVRLAVPKDIAALRDFLQTSDHTYYWLGARRNGNGQFRWDDNTPISGWRPKTQDKGNCLSIHPVNGHGGAWNGWNNLKTQDCEQIYGMKFVCEFIAAPTTAIVTTTEAPTIDNPDPCSSSGATLVGGKCLIFNKEPLSWEQSRVACKAKGQRLAVLQDPNNFHAYMRNTHAGSRFWLGGSDIDDEGTWTWITGQSMDGFPWPGVEPNDDYGREDCLEWGWAHNYNDADCTAAFGYVCEYGKECPEDEGFFYQESSQQCFFWPNKTNTWNQVSSFCDDKGLIIAHPKDPIGLRRMMVPLYGHAEPWVNTLRVGNTNNYQWQDDSTILASDSSLWFPGQPEEYGQGCVILLVWDWRLNTNPDQPYYARPCSGYGPPYYGYYTLCELVLA